MGAFDDIFAPAARIVLAFLPSGPCVARTEVVDGEEHLVVAGVHVVAGYQTFAPGGPDGSLRTSEALRRMVTHAHPTQPASVSASRSKRAGDARQAVAARTAKRRTR